LKPAQKVPPFSIVFVIKITDRMNRGKTNRLRYSREIDLSTISSQSRQDGDYNPEISLRHFE
jgi:hypothetical protein